MALKRLPWRSGGAQVAALPSTLEASSVGEAGLSPSVVQRGLRLSVVEGALATVQIQLTAGAFLTGYALLLGAREFELGLLGAMPFIGQLFQFAGAYLQERLGERRRLVSLCALVSRALWAPMALLPFVMAPGPAQLLVFLVLLAISQALGGIVANGWMSWMSDLVPARQRGSYFGMRNTVASVTAITSTWLAGRALDRYMGSGAERDGYAFIFGAGVVCALIACWLLWRQPEPPLRRQARTSIRELFSAPLRDSRFRSFCMAAAGWGVVTGIASPFFHAYGIQTLGLSFTALALQGALTSAISLVSQPLVGRMQDRYGDKRVLVYSVLGVILLPWGWVLATPTFLLPLWLNAAFAGVFWPGINQGLFNQVIERSPAEGRGAFIAAYSVLTGAGTFVASLLGGALAAVLANSVIHLGPLTIVHFAMLFVLSSLGRAAMAFVFWRKL